MTALAGIGGEERYWVHIPARKPRAYKNGGLVAAAKAVKGSPDANMVGDSELIHVNKYELEQLREMWGEPAINPETGLPAFGLFKTLGKIVKGVAKIAATVALTPVLGPVGASMVVNAADTAISGGDIGDIAKSAAFAGATAGAGQLGAKFAPEIGISADVGRAVGAGLGATTAGVVTGQSFEDAAMGGLQAGIGTYATNRMLGNAIRDNTLGIGDAYKGLTNFGYDIANATGIGGGGNYGVNDSIYGDEIRVTAPKGTSLTYTGPTDIGPVTSGTASNQNFDYGRAGETADQVVDENGNIIVTGGGTTNLTLGPDIPKITSGIGGEELQFDEEGNPIIVTGAGTNLTTVPGSTTSTTTNTEDEKYTPPGDEIVVNATGTNLTTVPGSTTTVKEDVGIINPNGTITPLYPGMPATTTATTEVPNLVPAAGRYTYTPLNRGLADIGFDPFTYGQAVGGQPGEFLFFTQDGRPYGQVGRYINGALERPVATVAGIGDQNVVEETETPIITGGDTDTGGGTDTGGTNTGGTTDTGGTTNTGGSGRLTLTLPNGPVGGGQPVVMEGGNLGRATPENTGYTAAQLVGRQTYYDLMRDPNVAALTGNINKTIASQLNANKISLEQARSINDQLQALYQTPGTTSDAIRGLATTSLRDAVATYKSANPPAVGVLASQNPDSASYTAGVGPADVYAAEGGYIGYAEGGEASDDMVSHLIAYQKGGGHMGPGRVKGIGSGQEDKIPAWLSDGEYVWSAQDVADLGDGSTDEGVRRLDKMRQMVRKQAGRKDVKKIAKPQRGIDEMLMAVGGAV